MCVLLDVDDLDRIAANGKPSATEKEALLARRKQLIEEFGAAFRLSAKPEIFGTDATDIVFQRYVCLPLYLQYITDKN